MNTTKVTWQQFTVSVQCLCPPIIWHLMWVGCDVEPVLGLAVGVLGQEAQEQCPRLWGQHRWWDSKKKKRWGWPNSITVSLLRFSEPVLLKNGPLILAFSCLMCHDSKIMSCTMWHISKLNTHVFIWASTRPAYAVFFTSKCFPSNAVTSTKYWLKLSILCDLMEIILCTLCPEASGSSR